MNAQPTFLLPVINQVIDFIESSLAEISGQEEKTAALNTEIERRKKQEKVLLEKVASASIPVFNEKEVAQVLDHLESLRMIKPFERIKLASEIRTKPASVLKLLASISENLGSASAEGEGYAKESSVSEFDPDGWSDFAEGRRVKQKQ